ncbi:hypothetical protein [Comamonas sp. AG1104]|uniref:hypothetical protein n=1 Tax=Comamonas sp. AG1104 TaxID=2183900 RepID=UPI001314DA2F|nr:hypothetical protein [Comamonas sp. AG1104]
MNVAGAPALTEKLAAAAALMNSKPCVSIVIGLLNRGNDEVPGGAIVKLEVRRIVALGSPSAMACASAERNSASVPAVYCPADAPAENNSAMAKVMGDACETRAAVHRMPREKLDPMNPPPLI